jgi:hypothetical protein
VQDIPTTRRSTTRIIPLAGTIRAAIPADIIEGGTYGH